MCGAPATIVHHKTPHRGDRKLFWDRKNWSPVCKPCHDGPLQSMEKRR
jgi:5-methylcytosine-specific restriction endonuclease McrA